MLTAEEFAERHGGEPVELVAGVVRPIPRADARHGGLCANVIRHVNADDYGHVMSNDTFVQTRRNPDTVRGADLCFYSYERLPKGDVPAGLLPVPPQVVFEVRSPSDTWTEVFVKVGEYFRAGVQAVVVIDDDSKTASVYRGDVVQQTLRPDQTLELPDLLPGFSVAVEKFFA